jgi:hypothetical protein
VEHRAADCVARDCVRQGLEGVGRIAAVLAARDLHKLNNAFFRPGLLRFCMTVVKKLNRVAVRRGLLSFCR